MKARQSRLFRVDYLVVLFAASFLLVNLLFSERRTLVVTTTTTNEEKQEVPPCPTISDLDATSTKETPQRTVISSQYDTEKPLEIAWLMSFPNSGTSYTTRLIRRASLTSSASNYGKENLSGDSVPVFADQPTGPYWVDPLEQLVSKACSV